MDKIRKSFRSRKKNDRVPESSKPHQWQEDERKVREGCCSFQVKYLGCHEVYESRGIQVCEEAVKILKAKSHRSVWSRMSMRKKSDDKAKGKSQRAILYVSGDALRVVDEISKGLIVDQTIEKVSFCAPDRNYDKAFAYICRDGTTRRWLCHAFLAVKETGERLSHAVGCAFAICLEKKQKREKEAVQVTYNAEGTSFTRTGSFRPATLTERLADPQSTIVAEPVPKPSSSSVVTASVERPHATDTMLQKQASFRGFNKLSLNLPFKRQTSLRLGELPSTLERQQQMWSNSGFQQPTNGRVSPIMESSPPVSVENINDACKQLTQGIATLTTDEPDPFSNAPFGNTARPAPSTVSVEPSRTSNPWSVTAVASPEGVPDADKWLHSIASSVSNPRGSTTIAPFSQTAATIATSSFQHSTVSAISITSQPVYPTAQPVFMPQNAQASHPTSAVAPYPFATPNVLSNQQTFSAPFVQPLVAAPVQHAFTVQQPVAMLPGGTSHPVSQPTFLAFNATWPQNVQPLSQPPAFTSPAKTPVVSTLHMTTTHGTNGGLVSVPVNSSSLTQPVSQSHAPRLALQSRSHTFDVGDGPNWQAAQQPTLISLSQPQQTGSPATWTSFNGVHAIGPTTLDPFDVAWAAKAAALKNTTASTTQTVSSTNTTFQASGDSNVRSFHVNL